MKIFGINISISREKQPEVAKDAGDFALAAGLWPDEGPSGTVLSNAYEQVAWVYRAINALAEQVSNIPFRFSTTSAAGEQLITTGPLVDFYGRPHPQLNRFQYWELRVIWLMLRGECFRIPIFDSSRKNGRRGLKSVLILDPARFQHIVQGNQLVGYGLYKGGFLNAVPVGFIPLRWEDGGNGCGNATSSPAPRRRYLEQELLEVSAVAIPANPDALALGLKSGAIAKSDLRETLELLRGLMGITPETEGRPPYVGAHNNHWLEVARELRRVMQEA